MWTTSGIKSKGKSAFKLNYWKCVLVSFLLGSLTAGTTAVSYNETSSDDAGLKESFDQLIQSFNALDSKEKLGVAAAIAGALTLVIVVSLLLKIFVFNPLEVGCLRFFRDNVTEPPAELGCIGEGFKNYMHTFITLFLQDLFVTLWTLLLIIPGFIKAYSYRLVPYLLSDRPDLSPTETLRLSSDLMRGHKWHAFCYDLSFIGWYILTALTLGLVGLFYAGPYKDSSDAALYLAIKGRH